MKSPNSKTNFDPLLDAFRKILSWLESNRPPRVILATLTAEELRDQQLPSHCIVRKRELQGTRVPVRGRRKADESPAVIARWPKDGLLESEAAELMFVISGEGDLRLSDYNLHCREGDIIYVPPRLPKFDGRRPVYEIITPESHCDILFIRHALSPLAEINASISHSNGKKHAFAYMGEAIWHQNDTLKHIFMAFSRQLQDQFSDKSTFYLLGALVALQRKEIENGNVLNAKSFPSESALMFREGAIQQAIRYIENHLNKPLSIDQVARWVGLSRTIFTTRFREKTGKSFKEFQTELRMERVKVLLSSTDLTIDRISDRVGLTPGQLRQLFHQKYHCSPSEFRNSKKNVR